MDIDIPAYVRAWMTEVFPNLREGITFEYTSPVDYNYNCLAWALSAQFSSFEKGKGYFWAWSNIPDDTSDGWAKVCEVHGFVRLENLDISFQEGFEKIAILEQGEDLHATRQDRNGKWKSKIGEQGPDIDHDDLECLESGYGKVVVVLRRQRPDWVGRKSVEG
jgi:hypothetical protein